MSDAPTSPPTLPDAIGRRSPLLTQHAFLVHSPNTFAKDLPPDVDNKPLARQKRRRTSKEDEEILKAEYLLNPKPDKAVRMEIVSKVALGEKEVQIWFQNKRQNDRRRLRPLEPSSSASLLSDSMSDPVTEDECNVPEQDKVEEPKDVASEADAPAKPLEEETVESVEDTVEAKPITPPAESTKTASPTTVDSNPAASPDPQIVETAPPEPSNSQQNAPASQRASQARTSWISNRRSASFRYTEDYAPENISFANPPLPTLEPSSTTRNLKRTHSFVRLSMTDDGTARVITDADKTPSPPHKRTDPNTFARASGSLRRSYSAAGFNDRLTSGARGEPSPKVPRTSNIGRSRDSRAWEFWCDPDTRHSVSLTTRADQEGSGSAADAIGLLRANRKILGQNHARQNTSLSRHDSKSMGDRSAKKSRGPMQRASTTHGRLQSKQSKKLSESDSDDLPQTESDKENWEPDVPQSQKTPRNRYGLPTPNTQRHRAVLGENTDIMSQSSSLGAMLAKERNNENGVGVDPEQDDDLRTFMNGGGLSSRTNLSSAEEAGCVEGLLKLSQGNWK